MRIILPILAGVALFCFTANAMENEDHRYQQQIQIQIQKPQSIQELRPTLIQKTIKQLFKERTEETININKFGFYGAEDYSFAGINPKDIITGLINKKDNIIIVDVGAGNGKWGETILKHIKEMKKKNPEVFLNKKIDIYSLTGESLKTIYGLEGEILISGKQEIVEEVCTNIKHHLLGKIEIENISETTIGKILKDKVDLIVSRYCFMHLCDAPGTIIQLRDLLIPKKGIMAADLAGIDMTSKNGDLTSSYLSHHYFLLTFNDSFIIQRLDPGMHFILKRENNQTITIKYKDTENIKEYNHSWKKPVALIESNDNEFSFNPKCTSCELFGNNAGFYEELIAMNNQKWAQYWNPLLIGNEESRFNPLVNPIFDALDNKDLDDQKLGKLFAKIYTIIDTMKNESGSPLLLEAIKKGKFRTLMENSDAIDYTVTDIQDNTAAHVVTNIKDVELLYNNVKGHLDVSKYFNQWNKYKNTPLYNAAEIASDSGNKDILNFILDPKNGIKADINAKGKYDDTILHMCLLQRKNGIKKERNDQVIGILLEHGADPNINNKENITPVHYAAKFHNFEVLKMFLGGKIKANVNAQDNDSNTPLHYAIIPNSNNELERNNVVDLLIANGADLTLKNNKGQTPIEYLVEKRSKDAADNLIEYLEKRNQKNTF